MIIETSADKIFCVRTAASSKCDSIHTSLDEILEPSHLLQYLRARVVLDHRDGSDPKAIVHLCSNSPVGVAPASATNSEPTPIRTCSVTPGLADGRLASGPPRPG